MVAGSALLCERFFELLDWGIRVINWVSKNEAGKLGI